MEKYRVLFVCLGFESVVAARGASDRFEADSAGIYSGHQGQLPDRRMRSAAAERGYDLVHRARPVSSMDFLDFDLVIAMDDQNYEDLMHLAPSVEATHKIKRMASYLTTHSISYIPDPYYMGRDGFELVLDLLEEACTNLYLSIA